MWCTACPRESSLRSCRCRAGKSAAVFSVLRPRAGDWLAAWSRDHGELSQAPAADRDWDDYHAYHDRKQNRRVGEWQREALRPSDRPDDDNGERMDETSDAQDQEPLRPEKNAIGVCGQRCDPAGIS